MKRREFITLLGGAAMCPLTARAQQPAMPVVGFVDPGSPNTSARYVDAFRKGLSENSYVEGRNVTVEYHYLEGQFDRLPTFVADLVRRRVAVSPRTATPPRLRPKLQQRRSRSCSASAKTRSSLVLSPASPGLAAMRPASIISTREVDAKRLGLLHDLVPKAARVAVLVNPTNPTTVETTLRDVQEAASAIGLQVQILNATTIGEIDADFVALTRERSDALFVAADAFFGTRRGQLVTLTAVNKIPAAFGQRDYVAAGGLMSYGTDLADAYRQVGVYTGRILKGAKPADLPVVQSTKFEFVINLKTAKTLGLTVSNQMQLLADEVIE